MPRGGLAYERTSRMSQVLILCFGVAVLAMGAWLAMMIMFPNHADTVAADTSDVPAMATKPAPRVENTATAYDPPLTNAPQFLGAPQTNAYSPTSAGSSAASPPAPAAAGPAGNYATSALASYGNLPSDAVNEVPESIPLPPPRPLRRMAVVPVPRPRPHIDEPAEVPPPRERSFFDVFLGR